MIPLQTSTFDQLPAAVTAVDEMLVPVQEPDGPVVALPLPLLWQVSTFLSSGVGAVSRTLFAWLMDRPINPKNFGVTYHDDPGDMVDSGSAWTKTFNAAALLRLPIETCRGYTLITDDSIFAGGVGYILPKGCTISGHGAHSVIRFKRVNFASFYGLTLRENDVTLRDLTIEVDNNGGANWCAAIGALKPLDGSPIKRPTFENLNFRGIGAQAGVEGVHLLGADIDDPVWRNCTAENMTFGGWVKAVDDTSTQRRVVIDGFRADNCVEVFEFNSPGLFRGVTNVGSAVITAITQDNGNPFDTSKLAVGQAIRSTAFPTGTTIVSIDSGTQITLSANATVAHAAGDKARLSGGSIETIRIKNFVASNISQWGLGFANCHDVKIEADFDNMTHECIHIEDASEDFSISIGGKRFNMTAGGPNPVGADNGIVAILPGCKNIHVHCRDADLRDTPGNPALVHVYAEAITGTLGLASPASGVRLSGRALVETGALAVQGNSTHVDFGDFIFDNVNPAAKASPACYMPGCSWSGKMTVINPGRIFECDVNSVMLGALDNLTLVSTEANFPSLDLAGGFFAADRNGCCVAKSITLHTTMTANATADWGRVMKAPATLVGKVSRTFHGTGGNHAYEVAPDFRVVAGALVPTDIIDVVGGNIDLTPGSGAPKQTDDGWRINAGILEMRAYSSVAEACKVTVTIDAAVFAK